MLRWVKQQNIRSFLLRQKLVQHVANYIILYSKGLRGVGGVYGWEPDKSYFDCWLRRYYRRWLLLKWYYTQVYYSVIYCCCILLRAYHKTCILMCAKQLRRCRDRESVPAHHFLRAARGNIIIKVHRKNIRFFIL